MLKKAIGGLCQTKRTRKNFEFGARSFGPVGLK